MKHSILTFFFLSALSLATFANNVPSKGVLFTSENVEISLSNADQLNVFSHVSYDVDKKTIDFESNDHIQYVQIFSQEGELVFQLLVDAKIVHLGKNLFETGDYKLGFLIDGQTDVYFSDLKVK